MSDSTDITNAPASPSRVFLAPPIDVFEGPDGWLIRADVPGARADGVRVHLDSNRLTIEADRAAAVAGREVFGRAPAHGYRRALLVPEVVDGSAIVARLSDGVLEVTLPKDRRTLARQITVTT